MRVLVTGANGFIGKNLVLQLQEQSDIEVLTLVRQSSKEQLLEAIAIADAVIHLAGENRPNDTDDFERVNVDFTRNLCEAMQLTHKCVPMIFASSVQVELDNQYGRSKLAAEELVKGLANSNGNPVTIYRLPGVFGKWCKPNYNSVVATFCHNTANALPIQIRDPAAPLRLVYVDDVISSFLRNLIEVHPGSSMQTVTPEYTITLGELAAKIESFKNCRTSLMIERVGEGLTRALYATYVSYLPKKQFVYDLVTHGDARGVFVEMLKTPDAGQFSYFTAHPGVTRGGHYHHSKTEKFLVIKGKARFGFRHMLSNDIYSVETSGDKPQVVETVPGWTHDITNIGAEEMVVMLWANEVFDRAHPDTISSKVVQ
jgi:UDP-2-acetamido-2,6-beta-L-arabino-hexul-4-ose reductase